MLNIGVLVAAASLLSAQKVPRALVALLFLVGALLAFLSFLANDTQRGYYTAARDLKAKLESRLHLSDVAIATTPGMGSGVERLGKVGTFLKTMLVAIALVDLAGAGISGYDALDLGRPESDPVEVAIDVRGTGADDANVVVASQNGIVLETRHLVGNRVLEPFHLQPGRYSMWANATSLCRQSVTVTDQPLQHPILHC